MNLNLKWYTYLKQQLGSRLLRQLDMQSLSGELEPLLPGPLLLQQGEGVLRGSLRPPDVHPQLLQTVSHVQGGRLGPGEKYDISQQKIFCDNIWKKYLIQ